MDQLTPTTSTLEPAVAHIADTAAELSRGSSVSIERKPVSAMELSKKSKARDTVIWALSSPRRFQKLIEQGQHDVVRAEHKEVLRLIEVWGDIPGTHELLKKCEDVTGRMQ